MFLRARFTGPFFLFALACSSLLPSQTLGQIEPVQAYTVSPNTVIGDRAFTISLLTYNFNCATTYDMLSSSVNGNTISLTFLDHDAPKGAICPAIYAPYGPTYTLPALKAGTYKVITYQLPACAPQGCKMASIAGEAGNLVVTSEALGKDNWYLKKNEILANNKFTMQILNQKYGNCQTSFSNQSVSISGGAIWTQFLINTDPKLVCIMDIRPHGPTFEMEALKPGKYPIYVTELFACEVKAPFCAVDRLRPTVSDTLLVSATLTTLIHGKAMAMPKARFHGRQLRLEVPPTNAPSLGVWTAEVLTLSGQVLESHHFIISKTGSGIFNISTQIERGLYLIRLLAPSGEMHSLPIVRKD
jgi:hypothetical protein